jgi:signal transduction histidine kinase
MSANSHGESTNDSHSTDVELNKLIQENSQLKEANQSLRNQFEQIRKEQIIYLQNVSHQLVAPLNAIKWHIENLTAGRLRSTDRIQKVLRSIYSQATISVHLAKNFALMSNLEADQTLAAQREPLEPVDLKRLMVNLANDFQPLGWDKNVHVSVTDYPLEEAPPVYAIKNLISQAFSNIIENAIKYSETNTEIEIYGEYNSDSDTVSVFVSNEGIPLPSSDEIELIFSRGYRSKDAQNIHPAGTGFGMYIAKKIVDIHEGSITAYADKGDRSVFQITLSVKGLKGKANQRESKDSAHHRR